MHMKPLDEAIHRMMECQRHCTDAADKAFIATNMMERKKGHLSFLGSQAGKVADTPKSSIYAASKHAIIGYTNALRMEVAPFGIHVTTINPGPIDTPFLDIADKTGEYRRSLGKHLLAVETVVDAVVKTIEKPVREVSLPWYMAITSKLYAVAPGRLLNG